MSSKNIPLEEQINLFELFLIAGPFFGFSKLLLYPCCSEWLCELTFVVFLSILFG